MNGKETRDIVARKMYMLDYDHSRDDKVQTGFLYDKNFYIPAYQRPYSWNVRCIRTLLDDFYKKFKRYIKENKNKDERFFEQDYFIGNITIMVKSKKTGDFSTYEEIIDGQQRVLSIYLIFKWLRNYVLSCYDEKNVNIISKVIADLNDRTDSFKINTSYPDQDIILKISSFDTNKEIIDWLHTEEKEYEELEKKPFYLKQIKVFKEVFNEINSFFCDFIKESEKNYNIDDFYKYIGKHIFCLYIRNTPEEQIGHLLFLSLNGKGLGLNEVDLIKSYFAEAYMSNSQLINEFQEKWGKLIEYSEDKLDDLMFSYFRKYKIKKSKNWVDTIIKTLEEQDVNRKEEYKELYIFSKKIKDAWNANTGKPKIDLWLKLAKIFDYTRYFDIYFHIVSQLSEEQIDDSKYIDLISEILEKLFKINFLTVTYFKTLTPAKFIPNFIDRYLSQFIYNKEKYNNNKNLIDAKVMLNRLKNDIDTELNKILNDHSQEINNFNIEESLPFPIVKKTLTDLDSKFKKFFRLISIYLEPDFSYSSGYDRSNTNKFIHKLAIDGLNKYSDVDHFFPKAPKKTEDCIYDDDEGLEHTIYFISSKKDSDVDLNFPDEKGLKECCGLYPPNVKKNDFLKKFIHKPFNLRCMDPISNRNKKNKIHATRNEVINNSSKEYILNKNNKLNSAFLKFLNFNKRYVTPLEKYERILELSTKLIINRQEDIKNKTKSWYKEICSKQNISYEGNIEEYLNKDQIWKINIFQILAWDLKIISDEERMFIWDKLRTKRVTTAHPELGNISFSEVEVQKADEIITRLNSLI